MENSKLKEMLSKLESISTNDESDLNPEFTALDEKCEYLVGVFGGNNSTCTNSACTGGANGECTNTNCTNSINLYNGTCTNNLCHI
jgi:hypothetical protein